ncbi:MAG: hypothetical protein J6J18_03610 [Oscillospiraceae bacterium]|nr:hypothetical protein [Oscillospiraceae bacterium]
MAKKKSEEKRVAVFVPRLGKDSAPVTIGINGKLYRLPRGKTSMVPEAVAKEFKRMSEAEERYDETVEKLRSKD